MSRVGRRQEGQDRPKVHQGKNAGIAKVLVGQGPDHAGMGIVVDPLHVVTCAHVVNVALGEEQDATPQPDAATHVGIGFPMLDLETTRRGRIVAWRPVGDDPRDDIAVIELDEPVPDEAGIAILANVMGMLPDGDRLSAYGLSAGERLGNHIDAEFKGPTSANWVQIDSTSDGAAFIERGFSGGAVWDITQNAVVGMVVAKRLSAVQKIAYMIPVEDLKGLWPDLQIEKRRLPATFGRIWTLYAAFVFFLLLSNWAVNRGADAFAAVAIGGAHKQLALFYGMNAFALFAPVLALLLLLHARDFGLHHWTYRIPAFGEFRARPSWSSTRTTAIATLVIFVALPIAAQIHFARGFELNGTIYVYPGKFGYDVGTFPGKCWLERSEPLCTNAEVGRYDLLAPMPGKEGGFWENAYHYGDLDVDSHEGSATYFPILQPVLLYILSALAVGLYALALVRIFRPAANRQAPRAEPL